MNYRNTFILSVMIAALAVTSHAQVPQNWSHQGRLDSAGAAVPDGLRSMTFRLYSAQSGGSPLWTEARSVSVKNGLYSVLLGEISAIPVDSFYQYMEIEVNGEVLSPRLPLTSVPYADRPVTINGAEAGTIYGPLIVLDSAAALSKSTVTDASATMLVSDGNDAILDLHGNIPRLTLRNNTSNPAGPDNVSFSLGTNQLELNLMSGPFEFPNNFYIHNGDVGIGTPATEGKLDVLTTGEHAANFVNDLSSLGIGVGAATVVAKNTNARGIALYCEAISTDAAVVATNTHPGSDVLRCFGEGYSVAFRVSTAGVATTKVLEITGGADLAEPFDISASDALPAGAIAIIDEDNPGKLKLSNLPYDGRVAGVISGAGGINPGLTLSQEGVLDGGQNVALSGRVYCLADASNGSISPGDLLTTSSTPGHAMRAADRDRAYGAVIGKAMTGLESGQGLVLVLVNLQ